MSLHRIKVLFLLFLFIPILAHCQELEGLIDNLLNDKYPESGRGAVALVAKGDQIIYHKAFGKANLELDVPMRTEMVFRIASISKQFTAIAILMLMEEKKLKLEDTITKYMPDYPKGPEPITIQHLLTHTSGISRSITQNPWNADIRKHHFEVSDFIDYFKNEPKAFTPGEFFQYNNFGYVILGHIIEKVSGISYGQFIEQRIFQPLGMTNSRQANDADVIKNRAYGYEKKENYIVKEYVNSSMAIGAGSLLSTTKDLYIWNRALLNEELVKKETLNLAFKNHSLPSGRKTNYGFGWFINDINGSPSLEHAGGDHGFRADGIYLPEEDVFVAILSNCSCGEPRPISTKIAALAIDKPYKSPNLVKVDSEKIYKWVGKYKFEDGRIRNVILKDEKLYWVISKEIQLLMNATSESSYVLENGLTKIQFELFNDSTIHVEVKNRISIRRASKPYTQRKEISLQEEVMSKYVGQYQITPDFAINVSLENGYLVATGPDQESMTIYPESNARFFFKAIDGQIEFISDKNGETNALEITQNGVKYSGSRLADK